MPAATFQADTTEYLIECTCSKAIGELPASLRGALYDD